MGVRLGRQAIVCAIVVVACAAGERRSLDGPIAVHAQPQCPAWHAKLDETLHRTLDRGSEERVGIIVRASSPTRRRQWRDALKEHGDISRNDLAVVGAFGAQVHLDDVNVLASDPTVQSVSMDSLVGAHQGTAPSS